MHRITERSCWRTWVNTTAQLRFDSHAAYVTRRWKKARAIRVWRWHLRCDAVLAACDAHRRTKTMAIVLWGWRRLLCEQRVARSLARAQAALLRSCVMRWRVNARWLARLRKIVPRAKWFNDRRMKVCAVPSCCCAWSLLCVCGLGCVCGCVFSSPIQRWVLRRWVTMTQLHQAVAFMRHRANVHSLRYYFQRWLGWTAESAVLRRSEAVVTMMVSMRRAREAWRTWRLAWVAQRHYKLRLMRWGFTKLAELRLKRAKTLYAVSLIKRAYTKLIFCAWHALIVDAKAYREMMERRRHFHLRMEVKQARRNRKCLATCFTAWRKWAALRRAPPEALPVVDMWRAYMLPWYFRTWADNTATASTLRAFTKRSAARVSACHAALATS